MTRSVMNHLPRRARRLLGVVVLGIGATAAWALGPENPGTAQLARPGQLPFYFEASPSSQAFPFTARGQACEFFVGPTEAVLQLTRADAQTPRGRHERGQQPTRELRAGRELRFEFVGANASASVRGQNEQPGKLNYFIGRSAAEWRTGVSLFGSVLVDGIYPGVDLVYYGNDQRLEYDFVVAPRADAQAIAIHFSGADQIRISAEGELVFTLGDREIRQPRPVIYQMIRGERSLVTGSYRLVDPTTVKFQVGEYDRNQPLVIDPVLSYATYFGGNGIDIAWAVAVDTNGFVYVAGETMGRLPITAGVTVTNKYSGATNGHGDAFVAKFDRTLTNLVALAYVGGKGGDVVLDLAVDGAGNAYLTGYTDSPDYPTTNAVYPNISGSPFPGLGTYPIDAFVTKLGPQGTNPLAVIYSTYLGGTWVDEGVGIDVDQDGAAYITGYTASTNTFPLANTVTNELLRSLAYGGGGDGFVAKISPSGSSLVYSMFLGGTNIDAGSGIVVDPAGVAHVTGYTRSTNFPAANGLAGGADVFVAHVAMATNVAYVADSRLMGGRGDNFAYRIALDAEGNDYIVGSSAGDSGLPVTPSLLNPGGIFRSDDAAANWQGINSGFHSIAATALAVDPNNSAHLFAATWHGLLQSWDGGAHWDGGILLRPNVNGYASIGEVGTVLSVIFTPDSPAVIYAGSSAEGVGKSVNGGTNFFGLDGLTNQTVRVLAVAPATSTTIYAGTDTGIYRSTDSGTNWASLGVGLANVNVRALALHPAAPIYAGTLGGVFRSLNGGTNWSAFNTGLSNLTVNALLIQSNAPLTLYAGTAGGVFRSLNGGTNWTRLNTGLTTSNVLCLAMDPATPETIYAGTTNGLFKSLNGGAEWANVTSGGLAAPYVLAVAIDPAAPTTLYAGTKGTAFFGGSDGYVAKFGTNGYLTVLGGSADDEAWDLAVDALGHAHVTGWTASKNFPTNYVYGALRGTNSGSADAFVAEVSSTGDQLLHSALLGGSSFDFGYSIALDSSGNSYIVGETLSTNFMSTTGTPGYAPFQASRGGTNDAFLVKLERQPVLTIHSTTNVNAEAVLTWPSYWSDVIIQSTTNLGGTSFWEDLSGGVLINGEYRASVPVGFDEGAGRSFFRLRLR